MAAPCRASRAPSLVILGSSRCWSRNRSRSRRARSRALAPISARDPQTRAAWPEISERAFVRARRGIRRRALAGSTLGLGVFWLVEHGGGVLEPTVDRGLRDAHPAEAVCLYRIQPARVERGEGLARGCSRRARPRLLRCGSRRGRSRARARARRDRRAARGQACRETRRGGSLRSAGPDADTSRGRCSLRWSCRGRRGAGSRLGRRRSRARAARLRRRSRTS